MNNMPIKPMRYFNVLDTSDNVCGGYIGRNPYDVSTKVFVKIIQKSKQTGVAINGPIIIRLKESVRYSTGKIYEYRILNEKSYPPEVFNIVDFDEGRQLVYI